MTRPKYFPSYCIDVLPKDEVPTAYGVREVRRDQDLVHHYYYITLQGVGIANAYLVEGLDTRNELTE